MGTFVRYSRLMILGILTVGMSASAAFGASPAGLWLFEDGDAPLAAATGPDLELVGEHEIIDGPGGRQAARIGVGSHYRYTHELAPNGGGEKVNQYTLVMDLRTTLEDRFTALFQTDPANEQDNVCEFMSREQAVGMGVTGYSRVNAIPPHTWFRLAVVVDNAAGVYDIYVDGEQVLHGMGQPLDGRYALDETVLFFGDDDGDDNTVDVALIAVFDSALSQEAIQELAAEWPLCPDAPEAGELLASFTLGEGPVTTGELVAISEVATEGDALRFRIDWGDGVVDDWRGPVSDDYSGAVEHSYPIAGEYKVKAQTWGLCGWRSAWQDLGVVTVEGFPMIELKTPPFQQNLQRTGITFMWEANANIDGLVRFLELEGDQPRVTEVASESTYSGFSSFIYRAHLENLKPGTEYRYEVVLGEDFIAGTGLFRTAPDRFEPFSFGVWADSQGENKGSYEDDLLEPTTSMMTHMGASGVRFGVGAGDHAENGNDYTDTRRFYLDRVARHLGTRVPYFIAWGNHDSYQDAVIRRFAHMPSAERKGFDPGYGSFAFSYADSRFICIDYASQHADIDLWLEDELKSPASQEARHRFLFVHVPPYCQIWIDGDAMLREKLVPLMEQYKVDACFSGHTHAYERGYKNGVHYVITGGGSWLDHGEEVVKEWPHMGLGGSVPVGDFELGLVNQYMRVNVTESGWNAECIAFNPDGSVIGVIDSFSHDDHGLDIPSEDDEEEEDEEAGDDES